MTFAPVIPPVMLLVIAAVVVALRVITMWQLAAGGRQRWSTVWRWSALTLAMVLMLIAAARPAIGTVQRQAETAPDADTTANVFLVVDRSADAQMGAIRDDLGAVVDRYPGARFALITFASRPSVDWPLSQDAWSLKPVTAGLQPYRDVDGAGVNAAAAATVLRYQLIAASQQYPGSQNLVFYFGSGTTSPNTPQGQFQPAPGSVDGGAVFGYGDPPDEPNLRRIADQLGVPYVTRDGAHSVTESTPDAAGVAPQRAPATASDHTELYWVFTLVAAVLLLFEVYLSLREFRTSRAARRDVVLR